MKVYNHARTKQMERIEETHKKHDELVLQALTRLGGKIHMRVMEFRKHIDEPLRETHIKKSLKRLLEKGAIELTSEPYDSRGSAYRIV